MASVLVSTKQTDEMVNIAGPVIAHEGYLSHPNCVIYM